MPQLLEKHIAGLAPLINPFEGHATKTIESHILAGEGHNDEFLGLIYDGKDNNFPDQFSGHLYLTPGEVIQNKIENGNPFPLKCFLWVIDQVSIKILWEMTSNIIRKKSNPEKPYVCHTNITGSGRAYVGGEMYFCSNGYIYVNFNSDRYGVTASEQKKSMAIQYMADCNYKNIIRTDINL
jgi:hypothetical protein